jgi:hypothetical protein
MCYSCSLALMYGPNHIQIFVFFMQFSCHRLLQPDTFLQTKTQVKKISELTLLCLPSIVAVTNYPHIPSRHMLEGRLCPLVRKGNLKQRDVVRRHQLFPTMCSLRRSVGIHCCRWRVSWYGWMFVTCCCRVQAINRRVKLLDDVLPKTIRRHLLVLMTSYQRWWYLSHIASKCTRLVMELGSASDFLLICSTAQLCTDLLTYQLIY